MRIHSTASPEDLTMEVGAIALRGLRPVVNGEVWQEALAEVVEQGGSRVVWRWTSPHSQPGTFGVELTIEPPGGWLRCWLDYLPADFTLDSFGVQFAAIDNLRVYLRNGYFSWDGSFFVEPESLRRAAASDRKLSTGCAMTQLLPRSGDGSAIVGFERHDRFQHTFTFDASAASPSLTILTLWDRKERGEAARCESERLLIFEHEGVEEALRAWARRVADASPTPPRRSAPRITGWCSWYYLYASITEENIREHLHGAAEVARHEALPMQVFQLDDGFTPEMGDWLEVKPQFPRGMKPLLDEIREAGFMPGLWIAPFMVGNRSRLYRDHPDWVVMDRQTGGPLVQMRFYAEFRWHKRSEEYYILDVTHPDAFAYLRRVFRTWRREWGCEYFKTDFMHFGSEHGPDRAVWHTPGMTRIELWRAAASMIREEIGEALWLGCGCPLWASVGLVDAVRIGRDIGVEWAGSTSAESLLRDQATRSFANGILWLADPDCILLRDAFHYLSDAEVRSLALYAGLAGSVIMTSDALDQLSAERITLWKFLLDLPAYPARFPLLGSDQTEPVIVLTRLLFDAPPSPVYAVLLFNTGDVPVQRTYPLDRLGFPDPVVIRDSAGGPTGGAPVRSIGVTLSPHESRLFFVSASASAPFMAQ